MTSPSNPLVNSNITKQATSIVHGYSISLLLLNLRSKSAAN